jgi:hypothetical protein
MEDRMMSARCPHLPDEHPLDAARGRHVEATNELVRQIANLVAADVRATYRDAVAIDLAVRRELDEQTVEIVGLRSLFEPFLVDISGSRFQALKTRTEPDLTWIWRLMLGVSEWTPESLDLANVNTWFPNDETPPFFDDQSPDDHMSDE